MRDFLLVTTDDRATWAVPLPASVIAKGVDQATLTIDVVPNDPSGPVLHDVCTTDGSHAVYSFRRGSLTAGDYVAEFTAAWVDGTVVHFREAPRFWVTVVDGVGGAAPVASAAFPVLTWPEFAAASWADFAALGWRAA